MDDAVKKALLIGIGAVALTKEKAEEFVADLKENKNITPEEGKKVVKDLLSKSNEYSKKVRQEIRKQVKNVMNEMGVVTKDDLEELKKELKK